MIRNIFILIFAAILWGGDFSLLARETADGCDSLVLEDLPHNCDVAAETVEPLSVIDCDLLTVRPLNTDMLYVAEPPTYKPLSVVKPIALDKSVRFNAKQLIAPATLVAVSTFGLWNKQAKRVNESVRATAERWRGDNYFRADDYIQYLPVVSYMGLGLAGVKAKHNFKEHLLILGTSYIAMGIMVNAVKYTAREMRPDNSSRNSYPSGHTATAFMGAELVRSEYGLGYGIAAYVVASGIGVLRIYNNRHWLNDVLAGAGIGILSARIGYWMLPVNRRIFGMERVRQGFTVTPSPFFDYNTNAVGGGVAIRFR